MATTTIILAHVLSTHPQARRNLADHARFLATLPYEESDGMDQDNSVVVMSHSIPSAVPSGPRGDEVPNTMDEVQVIVNHLEQIFGFLWHKI